MSGSSHNKSRVRKLWEGMRQRSNEKRWIKHPFYRGVSISAEFSNFDCFAAWAVQQIGWENPEYQIDKDILIPGNLEYSPMACAFVPPELNRLLPNARAARGALPVGVSLVLHNGTYKFWSRVSINDKQIHLGRFSTAEDAFLAYKTHKETHIKEMAEKYRDVIDPRVYVALMNKQIQITD